MPRSRFNQVKYGSKSVQHFLCTLLQGTMPMCFSKIRFKFNTVAYLTVGNSAKQTNQSKNKQTDKQNRKNNNLAICPM